jgi:16S rRNA (uracil1498-N3)-methyltransferase
MTLTRVYHPDPVQPGSEFALGEQAAHHLARVLRIREREALVVFDGTGGEWRGVVAAIGKAGVRVRVTAFDPVERESPLAVTLAQVVSAGERMDFTVQKAVELGVARIQPLQAGHAKVRLSGERAERRVAHWQRVVASACEQCGRNRVPEVAALDELLPWAAAPAPGVLRLLLTPHAGEPLSAMPKPQMPVVLAAGAEAGFTADEEEFILSRGFTPVRLGPRILRTETAAMAALAAMQALWGDL